MTRRTSGRLRACAQMAPAVGRARVRQVRRALRRTRSQRPQRVFVVDSPLGPVTMKLGLDQPVLIDGAARGTLSGRVDLGTSTLEVSSQLPDDPGVVSVIVSSVASAGAPARRIAWFVAVGDTPLEQALLAEGFEAEGWAAPPTHDPDTPYQRWAKLHEEI